ncbi:unnamed protein product, partial [Phaeothamnion confervicola]
ASRATCNFGLLLVNGGGHSANRIIVDWASDHVVRFVGLLKSEKHRSDAELALTKRDLWAVFARALEGVQAGGGSVSFGQSASAALLQGVLFVTERSRNDTDALAAAAAAATDAAVETAGMLCRRRGATAAAGCVSLNLDAAATLVEKALALLAGGPAAATSRDARLATSLLELQLVLQVQHTNQRKVFTLCCSRLLGPLLAAATKHAGARRQEGDGGDGDDGDEGDNREGGDGGGGCSGGGDTKLQRTASRRAADVLLGALFRKEHLEGYANVAVHRSAGGGSLAVAGAGNTGKRAAGRDHQGGRKRQRGDEAAEGGEAAADGGAAAAGGAGAVQHGCYQQQLIGGLERLLAGGAAERGAALAGMPLLLRGYIGALEPRQRSEGASDAGGSAGAGALGPRRKSRGVAAGLSPTMQFWIVLARALAKHVFVERRQRASSTAAAAPATKLSMTPVAAAEAGATKAGAAKAGAAKAGSADFAVAIAAPEDPKGEFPADALRCCNALLALLVDSDAYRATEDWSGEGLAELRAHAALLLRCTEDGRGGDGSGGNGGSGGCSDGTAVDAGLARALMSLLSLHHEVLQKKTLRGALLLCFHSAIGVAGGTAVSASAALLAHAVATYARARQMDRFLAAFFGAAADAPRAATAAALARGTPGAAAVAAAFGRLPDRQVEMLWGLIAAELKKFLQRAAEAVGVHGEKFLEPTAETRAGGDGSGSVRGSKGGFGVRSEEAGEGGERDDGTTSGSSAGVADDTVAARVLALFAQSVRIDTRNAELVGALCGRFLLEAAAPAFTALFAPVRQVATLPVSVMPDTGQKKRKHQPTVEASTPTTNTATVAAPAAAAATNGDEARATALEAYGWLLHIDARAHVWSVTAAALSASARRDAPGAAAASTAMPELAAVHEWALAHGAAMLNGKRKGIGGFTRLAGALQAFAMHRLQQLFSRASNALAADSDYGPLRGLQKEGQPSAGLKAEATALAELACMAACASSGGGGDSGSGIRSSGGGGGGVVGWGFMMSYLPVWVGYASERHVRAFLRWLLDRCAAGVAAAWRSAGLAGLAD